MKLHKGSFDRIMADRSGKRMKARVSGWVGCTDDGSVAYGLHYAHKFWTIVELSTGLRVELAGTKADAIVLCEKLKDKVLETLKRLPEEQKGLNK